MSKVIARFSSSRRLIGSLLLVAIVAVIVPICAQAADPATPCDPLYMNAIEARAYLEAQREISSNQNLILKPDSVLEYTCFDRFLGVMGNDDKWAPADGPFSDSEYWGPVPNQGPGRLNGVLNSLILPALTTYLTDNFQYPSGGYLGGRDQDTYEITDSGTYDCEVMAEVWQEAQCMNFFNQLPQDAFYDFPWYENNDPRQLPYPNACAPNPAVGQAVPVAFNTEQAMYTLNPDNSWPNGGADPYDVDPVNTHYDLIMPNGTVTSEDTVVCGNVAPIPTGVCVIRAGWSQEYQDAVCPNPGCHYKAPGNSANNVPTGENCPGALGRCAGN